jgi:hypothetical protein
MLQFHNDDSLEHVLESSKGSSHERTRVMRWPEGAAIPAVLSLPTRRPLMRTNINMSVTCSGERGVTFVLILLHAGSARFYSQFPKPWDR